MASYLVLTTDLPYFPGKNGHDFFNLRHLGQNHRVGVIAPLYDFHPQEGVANLERAVAAAYLWPRPAPPTPLFIQQVHEGELSPWLRQLPVRLKTWLLHQLLGISRDPDDAYQRLAIMANCAPQLLHAMEQNHWQGIILIQTSNRPWLDFLPRLGAKCVYFHDVRSDYLRRARPPLPSSVMRKVHQQEEKACTQADAVGFVSDSDLTIARQLLPLPAVAEVAPIPVDQSYFTPPPPAWPKPTGKTVLFTGHLSHPPNIDAVEFLVRDIWPAILAGCPDARLVVTGLQPHPRVRQALAGAASAELHENVPDIRPYFWNASVYVVPMRFGGGVRQKILEAWTMRVPVVCTPMGAEGTGAVHERHCWLEQDPTAFARQVVSRLMAPAPSAVLEEAAGFARRGHAVEVAGARFEQLCQGTVRARRQREFRLLYDLRWMEIGRSGGTEQMTHELIHAIGTLDRRNRYTAYVPRSTFHEWNLDPAFSLRPVFSDEVVLRREQVVSRLANRLAETTGHQPILTPEMRTLRALAHMDFDLVHSTCGYTHPDLARFPNILTALDLQHIHYPEFFTPSEWAERDRLYRQSTEKAQHIICISEYTRQDMHRHYGVPLDKMTAIWLIPSRHAWSAPPRPLMERLLAGMGITSPFLFFPGHCWPHKNHAKLIEAFALILPHIPKDMQLIFSGRHFPADHPAQKLIGLHGLENRVRHLGYRSAIEVRALMHGCFTLVFPSLFEGYGIPVMDAIIAGKPVACSDCTSLPEIAGNAALTFKPDNIHDMGGRLLEIINDPARRATLVEAGRARRPLFSARNSAVKTLAVYRQVYDRLYS